MRGEKAKRSRRRTLDGIVTRAGDRGITGLAGGKRVVKTHARVEACGSVDELNCFLGMARVHVRGAAGKLLAAVQNDLFDAGADLASRGGRGRLTSNRVAEIERAIARYGRGRPVSGGFVLPGGSAAAAWCHLARAVCRRAERRAVAAAARERVRGETLRYLNRLSDLLYVLARRWNEGREAFWRPAGGPARRRGNP